MTKTSSLSNAASSIECVTIMTVTASFLMIEISSVDIISLLRLSKAANGSSKSNSLGLNNNALAIATLCNNPPDN